MVPARLRHLGLVPALALLLALALSWPGLAAADGAVESIEVAPDPTYWTPERMRAAEPVELAGDLVPPVSAMRSAAPAASSSRSLSHSSPSEGGVDRERVNDPTRKRLRTHGKVFFTVEGGTEPGDYLCSGTAIESNNRSVVWTAGHCVFDEHGGGYVSNFIFVPAYTDGEAPFGEWPAKKLAATSQWREKAQFKFDIGAAVVAKNREGRTLGEVVGGRGIAFNQPRQATYRAFGYPAISPPEEFDGETPFRCTSPLIANEDSSGSGPLTLGIACDMGGGSSGGGWVVGGSVIAVTSFKNRGERDRLYGPYQSATAKRLYESVAGRPQLCAGREVSILGTGGDDLLVGTKGPDVISALGGDDKVRGLGGRDIVCGGGGRDILAGRDGRDKLKGGSGGDRLRGGSGRDACIGGPGTDRGKSCERRRSLD